MELHNKRTFVYFLILLDIFMGLSATIVDWHDFFEVPWYLVLFVPICPLYPFLIAVCYIWFLRKGRFPPLLLNFTAVGVISYGAMAFIFYPLYMMEQGFGWYEFGNIFWVILYASQIFSLWPRLAGPLPLWQYVPIAAYFFAKDFLDRFSVTLSYHRDGMISDSLMDILFASILLLHGISLAMVVLKHRQKIPEPAQADIDK